MMASMEPVMRPRIRALQVFPARQGDLDGILLGDPLGLREGQVFIPAGLLPVVQLFDGTRTPEEIGGELARTMGVEVPAEFVENVARDLDRHLCLEGGSFQRALAEAREAFGRAPVREAFHAGSPGYPGEAGDLERELDGLLAEGPREEPAALRGLIAPHIDLRRGRRSYAATYAAVAAAPMADLYVVLGTCHAGASFPLIPTSKDFATPLGPVATDRAFVERVTRRVGRAALAEEFLHRNEHSIEFQALLLRRVFAGREDLRIAPFLVGSLPEGDGTPAGEAAVEDVVGALLEEAAAHGGRVCFVAAADLAHVGPHFGDPRPLADGDLRRLEEEDRRSLEACARGDAEGWWRAVHGGGNPRRVCGLASVYLTLRCLQRAPGRLLHYDQSVTSGGDLCVTHAAVAFPA